MLIIFKTNIARISFFLNFFVSIYYNLHLNRNKVFVNGKFFLLWSLFLIDFTKISFIYFNSNLLNLLEEKKSQVNISEGIKIIDEAKIDVKVLSRDAVRVEKSAPKLDASMPTFSGKSGERLDEWLYIMETA